MKTQTADRMEQVADYCERRTPAATSIESRELWIRLTDAAWKRVIEIEDKESA